MDFGQEIGSAQQFNQQFASQKISNLMAGEQRASQTAQGVANLSEQAQGIFQEKVGQLKEQAQAKAEQLPLNAELAVAGLPGLSESTTSLIRGAMDLPGTFSEAYQGVKTAYQGLRTAASSLMENPSQILGAAKNSIQQRISAVDFSPIEDSVRSQYQIPESMAGMAEEAEPMLTLARQIAAPQAEMSSALPGAGTSIEMTNFGEVARPAVIDTAADDAAAEIGVGVGEAAAEGGLEAATLAIPGVGEVLAGGLAVYGLVEGIKDLFSGQSSAPSAPVEEEAPAQAEPSFTSQASGQANTEQSFQAGV